MFKLMGDIEPLGQENLCECGNEGEVHDFDECGFCASVMGEQTT